MKIVFKQNAFEHRKPIGNVIDEEEKWNHNLAFAPLSNPFVTPWPATGWAMY